MQPVATKNDVKICSKCLDYKAGAAWASLLHMYCRQGTLAYNKFSVAGTKGEVCGA